MRVKRFFAAVLTMSALFGAVMAGPVVAPTTASAACGDYLLGVIPPWYRGLTSGSDCQIVKPTNLGQFVTKIALNVLQAALVAVGFITIFFIIKGGIGYMTSVGKPDGIETAKKTIMNAVIGLVISMLSAVIVNYIMGVL